MTYNPSDHDNQNLPPAPTTSGGSGFDSPTTGPGTSSFEDTHTAKIGTSDAGTSGADKAKLAADTAKQEASKVADTAVSAGQDVAETAKDEAANLATEAKQHAKSLFATVGDELQSQSSTQQQRIAASVRSLTDELGAMASGSDQSGPLTDLAHQAASKGGEIAQWLEDHEPRDLLREVQSFARRRPVVFLAVCGLAGVLAGRITRGAVAANSSDDTRRPADMRRDDAHRAPTGYPRDAQQGTTQPYDRPGDEPFALPADQGFNRPGDQLAADQRFDHPRHQEFDIPDNRPGDHRFDLPGGVR